MKKLWELAEEYLEEERALKDRIRELRERSKWLRGDDSRLMAARIDDMIRMAHECKRVGGYLKNYYPV